MACDPVRVAVEWSVRLDDRYRRTAWPYFPEDPDRRVPEPPEDPVVLRWISDLLSRGGRAAAYRVAIRTSTGRICFVLADVDVDLTTARYGVALRWASEEITDGDRVEEAVRQVQHRFPEVHRIAVAAAATTMMPGDRGTLLRGWETLVALDVSNGTILRADDPLGVIRAAEAAIPYRWLPALALAGVDIQAAADLAERYRDDETVLADLLDTYAARRHRGTGQP